jgi:hypothetical protein
MAAVALALDAWRREPGRPQLLLALAAGSSASAASLVKQNFLEGFVFVAGLVAADSWSRRSLGARSRVVLAGTVVGGLLPNALVYVWARAVGVDGLRIWQELATFRKEAFAVIWGQSTQAPVTRAVLLVLLVLVSGTAMVLVRWVATWREDGWRLTPLHGAVAATSAYGLVAIVAGGSYWAHYLLQLAAMTSLAAGVVAARRSPAGHRMRFWGRYVAGCAVVGALLVTLVYATVPWVWFQQRTGEWLAASSRPDDSVVVAYGSPSILESADLPSPYPYLWSLPMRTLDPQQARLRATLAGPNAPTWLVKVNPINSWDIDGSGRLRSLVETRYRVVASVCGHDVWLRADLDRDLAPPPDCTDRLPFLRGGSGGR